MKRFRGIFTALITPFNKGEVDFDSLGNLVNQQLSMGIDGFVISGTTGESPTLTMEEKKKIFFFVRDIVKETKPLIVGTGTNSTRSSIDHSLLAQEWGADAVLAVVPYYNKPPQRGLIEHFKRIANSVKVPVILYNVPGRTVTSLSAESVETLGRQPGIIGIKEASGKVELAAEIRQRCGANFVLLSGDDGTFVPFLQNGGNGVISVASHIIGDRMSEWHKVAKTDAARALNISKTCDKLISLLFTEANPIPLKWALHQMGVIKSPELRLPLCELQEQFHKELLQEMRNVGALK